MVVVLAMTMLLHNVNTWKSILWDPVIVPMNFSLIMIVLKDSGVVKSPFQGLMVVTRHALKEKSWSRIFPTITGTVLVRNQ